MNTVIETRAAMIAIDGAHPLWRDFVIAPNSSAATRRIPILLVSDSEKRRAEATLAGADLTASWREFERNCCKLVNDLARIPDPEMLDQLACACRESLPPLAMEGLQEFNQGNYYRQHDLFEEQWANTRGPVRDLYRAILQVGVAYYQIENNNYRGGLKMLQRSVQWLHIMPDACQGIDVEQLRRDSYAVRAELERLGPERLEEFDRNLLKPVIWHAP
ncbi:MAG: DUF309 domain-containing protein [Chloroflexi bacterium]|nr:DUF309 domain-containing protein [Chloroflexota bacterium]